MNARRTETISFWVSVVWASIAVAILGFHLAATTLPVSMFVFAVTTSWMGLYFGLNHLYEIARRMKDGTR